jgi:hypothetical protein
MMIEYLAQDEGLITHQLIFKDTGISERAYKKLEKLVKKYDEKAVLTHVPVADEVVIIVNKRCEDDECREIESERFIGYYNKILRKIK